MTSHSSNAPVAEHPYTAKGDRGRLVWLASYPKSGNTWLRALLTAYGRDDPTSFDLIDMNRGGNVLSRQWLDSRWGMPTTYLSELQRQQRMHATLTDYNRELRRMQFLKTHDAWCAPDQTTSIFAGAYTHHALVIVRNPLSIAPSLAHHMGCSIDEAISGMASPTYSLAGGRWRFTTQVPQHLGDWSSHVSGWLDQTAVPVTCVTYEALKADPVQTLTQIFSAIGVPVDSNRVQRAVDATRFERLQQIETDHGFREARPERAFFRRGAVDSWRDELTTAQVAAICSTHASMMNRLGYPPVG